MKLITSVPHVRPRAPDAHKGKFGRALIIGGSRGMTGAPVLAGTAATRSGAGLLTIAVPDRCLESVAAFEAHYMTLPVADDGQGRMDVEAAAQLMDFAVNITSIGLGPGMSQSSAIAQVVTTLYQNYQGPMVVDADALNALASLPDGLPQAPAPRILTPHVGEFRRLLRKDVSAAGCRDHAHDFAIANGVIVVLKGDQSLVTDGSSHFVNNTGNPGMATGGSGDVLTGILTALLGQDYSPIDAAILAVHVHGLAGDLARDIYGEISLLAENIRDSLPQAFQKLAQRT